MDETITCLYSCAGCGAKDRKVQLPVRLPGQDVRTWMGVLKEGISRHHTENSIGCTARTMQEVKIPMDGRKDIGGAVVQ